MQKAGLEINQADLNRIINKLQSLPSGIRRNAATSALNAGARVIRDKARRKAPACLKRSIKNVRLKQEGGDPVTAIAAGVGMNRPNNTIDKLMDFVENKKHSKPCVAIWFEFGTYTKRNLGMDPYAPRTLTQSRKYANGLRTTYAASGGRSPATAWFKPDMYIRPQPFMRPAMMEAMHDNTVEKAMVKKFDEYFKKIGV